MSLCVRARVRQRARARARARARVRARVRLHACARVRACACARARVCPCPVCMCVGRPSHFACPLWCFVSLAFQKWICKGSCLASWVSAERLQAASSCFNLLKEMQIGGGPSHVGSVYRASANNVHVLDILDSSICFGPGCREERNLKQSLAPLVDWNFRPSFLPAFLSFRWLSPPGARSGIKFSMQASISLYLNRKTSISSVLY